ncbi:phosphoribosyltransferase family protein [Gordonia sp. NPDC003585]|uniref:phosphoribosyltransferase n=1 Tax=Gordonia sp. NPDC003585 TaxID=3154275 RepID=UPI00339F6231
MSQPPPLSADHVFRNRRDAGVDLGQRVRAAVDSDDRGPIIVLGLARGGPVAREVADAVDCELDTLVVRKIGAPGQPEFAMGAITHGNHVVVNDDIPRRLGVTTAQFDAALARESRILADREARYRAGREPLSLADRVVILVDDGLATGTSMSVAIDAVRAAGASRVIVAVPTGPTDIFEQMRAAGADQVIVSVTPTPFHAVGQSYADFTQVGDDEVVTALERPNRP